MYCINKRNFFKTSNRMAKNQDLMFYITKYKVAHSTLLTHTYIFFKKLRYVNAHFLDKILYVLALCDFWWRLVHTQSGQSAP